MQCERDACTVIDHVTMVAVFTNKIIHILSGERFLLFSRNLLWNVQHLLGKKRQKQWCGFFGKIYNMILFNCLEIEYTQTQGMQETKHLKKISFKF